MSQWVLDFLLGFAAAVVVVFIGWVIFVKGR